jgi:phosphomannomutase
MGFTDNAMFTMIWMLNFLASKNVPLSTSVEPLRKYYSTGEINLQTQDKAPVFDALERFYAKADVDHLDGLTVQYPSWWFNLRPSNTEPVIRLNMEADSAEELEQRKEEVFDVIERTESSMKILV